jgi:hypothetical protein
VIHQDVPGSQIAMNYLKKEPIDIFNNLFPQTYYFHLMQPNCDDLSEEKKTI